MGEANDRTGGIQVIARAAALLRELGEHPAGLSLAALAARVGLARSTVQRIIQALETEGLVALSDQGYGFQLGPALGELLQRRQIDLTAELRPLIADLSEQIGETIALCKFSGAQVTVLECCIAEHPLRVVYPLGALPFPAHILAPGRALLANMAPERALQILQETMPGPEATKICATLLSAREPAYDIAESYAGLSAIAVAIRTDHGLFAISAVLPQSRIDQRASRVISGLTSLRTKIEARFLAE